jgi:crotonobetainyl-CoA:carnitine CoA-transferase CaiB-like acyl-CoA transferase
VAVWTATQDKAACAQLLQDHGVPATPVNLPGEVLESPQLAHRGSVERIDIDGEPIAVLGPPWRTTLVVRSGGAPDGVRGLRIVELTHVLAGPIVGALLGGMGAEVVRVEDLDRLDIYRRTGPFAGGVSGPERGAYFAVANHSKRSVASRGEELRAAVTRLADACDVLIENVGQSRLDRLGVDLDRLAAQGTLAVRVSGFGADGPLADYKVYANNVQSYGGLAWVTRDHDGKLARFGSVLADPLSSVIAATVIAAWALGPCASQGGTIDLAMVEVVAGCIAELVAAASTGSEIDPPVGNDLAPYAPHGVYELADGRWIAIAVHDDAEWKALATPLGAPPTLDRDRWNAAADRYAARRELDVAVQDVLRISDAGEAVAALNRAGVRAALVARGSDLVADEHLKARGFFPGVAHPDLGTVRIVGLPWRFAGRGRIELAPAPVLGSTTLPAALEAFGER